MPHVAFIHGLDNKPASDVLLEIWRRKLAQNDGLDFNDLGVTSAMVYWADALYPSPDTNLAAYEAVESPELLAALERREELPAALVAGDERLQRLVAALGADAADTATDLSPAEVQAIVLERVPMPEFLRKRIMKKLARDVYLYFYNESFSARPGESVKVRDELRRRFVDHLKTARAKTDRLVVVSHSMGTIIAYDCLTSVPDCPPIDGLMTVGSPLGIDEVQDFFDGWTRDNGFPRTKLPGKWVNVFDRLDIVAGADPDLHSDYREHSADTVVDVEEANWGSWRHSISKYLQGKKLRAALAGLIGVPYP
jgi:hypothetical protein